MQVLPAKLHAFLVVATVILIFGAVQVSAQMGAGNGQGVRMMRSPAYDDKTEISVSGTIEEVQQLTRQHMNVGGARWKNCPADWSGIHLVLKTDKESLLVHVGPSLYLESHGVSLQKGDNLAIVGSRVQYQGSNFVIAREITKGNQSLPLRDPKGVPLWSGSKKIEN